MIGCFLEELKQGHNGLAKCAMGGVIQSPLIDFLFQLGTCVHLITIGADYRKHFLKCSTKLKQAIFWGIGRDVRKD
jgi:hypothetical protein